MSTPFTIINEHGLEILGDTHVPDGEPVACALLLHGYKGYKDYGFIPVLANDLCERGVLVHRFNFSTSGMTNDIETFARADLFELDTWTRQVNDVRRIARAVREGEIAGSGFAMFLIGHSRGGATALLSAGRHRDELGLAGVATINAVDRCCRMREDEQQATLERGYMMTESARTKQQLRIDAGWLREQLELPEDHDVLLQGSRCGIPACILHGVADDAVTMDAGLAIAHKLNTPLIELENANHVLNMLNPSDVNGPRSEPLLKSTDAIARFIAQHAS